MQNNKQGHKNNNDMKPAKKHAAHAEGRRIGKGINLRIVILSLIILVAAAIVAYVVLNGLNNRGNTGTSPDGYKVYNGFRFEQDKNGLWNTVVGTDNGDVGLQFYYHPKDLESIKYNGDINFYLLAAQKKNGNLTIALSPSLSDQPLAAIAGIEISKITSSLYQMTTKSAYTNKLNGSDFPVASCADANVTNFVVQVMTGGDNSIRLGSYYCAILNANTSNDTIKLADRFVYTTLGIMKK